MALLLGFWWFYPSSFGLNLLPPGLLCCLCFLLVALHAESRGTFAWMLPVAPLFLFLPLICINASCVWIHACFNSLTTTNLFLLFSLFCLVHLLYFVLIFLVFSSSWVCQLLWISIFMHSLYQLICRAFLLCFWVSFTACLLCPSIYSILCYITCAFGIFPYFAFTIWGRSRLFCSLVWYDVLFGCGEWR